MSMFKIPVHQVAGHRAAKGVLGPLVDESGRFYKPLQSCERGSKEVAFYTKFWSAEEIPNHIRKFFPMYYGTELIEASDGSGPMAHLVLEDIVAGRVNPCVMDVKIGARTWYPQASEEYIAKCLRKDRAMTSASLGFRISGLQVSGGGPSGECWKPSKKRVQSFTEDDTKVALRQFVSSNNVSEEFWGSVQPDCSFAETVYGGPNGVLAQLLELKEWFEDQTLFSFYSCSVLVVYENGKCLSPSVKLVDFAHVLDGHGVIDHNFLGGLCSLIKFIRDILNVEPRNSSEPHATSESLTSVTISNDVTGH